MPIQTGSVPIRSASDGPRVTRNPLTRGTKMAGRFGGKTPSVKDVRDMVAAHSAGKVPPQLSDQYKKKVIGHARRANAMQHIPPSWLGGKGKAKKRA